MRHLAYLMCLGLLLFGWLAPVSAAEVPRPVFRRITFEQGLSQSSVQCMVQDQDGYLWIGTQDGLNRYDGYEFFIYRYIPNNPNSLINNDVHCLLEDSQGFLWIGTNGGGAARFDRQTGTFTRFYPDPANPTALAANRVDAIVEDQNHRIWLGTTNGLHLYHPETNSFQRFQHDPNNPQSIRNNYVRAIAQDSTGILWIGTDGGGVNRFDPTTRTFSAVKLADDKNPDVPSPNCISLKFDRQGNLWIGTTKELCRYTVSTGELKTYVSDPANPKSLTASNIRAIYCDQEGRVWIGARLGLNLYDPQSDSFIQYRHDRKDPTTIGDDNVRSIFQDRAGNVWVGLSGGGLNRLDYRARRFQHFTHNPDLPNTLSNESVFALHKDHRGLIWVSTSEGLNRIDPATGTVKVYPIDETGQTGFPAKIATCFFEDRNNRLWIGSPRGLCRYERDTDTFTCFRNDPQNPQSLSSSTVMRMAQDQTGNLWLSSSGYTLNRFDPQTGTAQVFRPFPEEASEVGNNRIWSLVFGQHNILWLATSAGLFRYDPASQHIRQYVHNPKDPKSITSNRVFCLVEDADGILWIGTNGGLNRFSPTTGEFSPVTTQDGLPDDNIYGIVQDDDGNLWLSTNTGLAKYNPRTRAIRAYDIRDGLQSNEFNSGAYAKSPQGELLFGGINGCNLFHPRDITDNPYIPPVVITQFRQYDHLVEGFNGKDIAPLRYDENYLSFEFAALNFHLPDKNQYAYQLEGFDRNWIYCGHRRFASYTNLDPGEYTFRVKASNNDGVWNEAGTALRVVILPPPWRTWWAYVGYTGLLTGLVVGAFRFQQHRLQTRAQLREAELTARAERETAQAKAEAAAQLAIQNKALDRKNQELAEMNQKLVESQIQADRIFSALAEALPGTVLDEKYRLDEKIGAGGFGIVFRATQLALNRQVAIKVFKPSPGNDSADAIERFRREGISASRVNHPNAIQVLDSGISADGIAFLVMELLQGQALSEVLKETPVLSVRHSLRIAQQVCYALIEAHTQGIIHRDIKPENVFLHQGPGGEIVKVLDFGVAKMFGDDTGEWMQLTATGGIVGTPAYMAPERLAAHPYDGRSDIYSLAVMMYELLCGRQPFAEHAQAFASLVVAHLQYPPPPVRKFATYVPETVEALVLHGLSKKPADRPSAQEFAAQIAQILSTLPEESDQIPESARQLPQGRELSTMPTAEFTSTNLVETQNLPSTRTNPE